MNLWGRSVHSSPRPGGLDVFDRFPIVGADFHSVPNQADDLGLGFALKPRDAETEGDQIPLFDFDVVLATAEQGFSLRRVVADPNAPPLKNQEKLSFNIYSSLHII